MVLQERVKNLIDERKARARDDDIVFEHFWVVHTDQIKVVLFRIRKIKRREAESALAYVAYLANKGLAHTTSSFTKHDSGAVLLEIAFRGIPVLVVNNFYLPLGIQPPSYELQSRPR